MSSTDRLKLDAIIAMAEQTVQAQAAAAAVEATASPQAGSSRSGSRPAEDEERRKRQKRTHMTEEELAEQKERRLRKLIGAVVVKSMNKYKDMMEHDTFKKYAREVSQTKSSLFQHSLIGYLVHRYSGQEGEEKKSFLSRCQAPFTI